MATTFSEMGGSGGGGGGGGGGDGEFTDTGTALHPNEANDSIVIGGTTVANSDIILNPDGSAVFNDQGAAVDFRIEGDTDVSLLVADGSADKVGIGVAVPAEKLDVNGTVKALAAKVGTAGTEIALNADGSAVFNDGGAAVDFRIEGDTDVSLLVADGSADKVGIGVAAPTEKLDVNGTVKALAGKVGTAGTEIALNADGSAVFNEGGAAVDFRIEGDTDPNLVVADGSADKVGIGVAVPTEKLDVNGIVKATSFAGSGANLTSLPFPWVAHTIDLQDQDVDTFYAVAVRYGAVGSDIHQFYLTMPSQGGEVSYNSHEVYGTVRGSGWQDRPSHSEVTMTYYSSGERSVLGIYHGTSNFDGYVIYLRGGLPVNYTLAINSMSTPVVNTGSYVVSGSTFATKNVSHVDVTGTSANISMLFDGVADAQNVMKEYSGTVNVGGVDGKFGVNKHYPLYPVHIGNGAHCTTGGVWTDGSTRAQKDNIVPLSDADATAAVMALAPQTYNYKDTTEEHCGFIAEDVPDLVASEDRSGVAAMDIVAVLTKVVQRQEVQIQQLLQSAP